MALVSLSSDIEERRLEALADLERLRLEINQAASTGPSDANILYARCREILRSFEVLADKMLAGPDDLHAQVLILTHRLVQAEERAEINQKKLMEHGERSRLAVEEAQRLAADRYSEIESVRRKSQADATAAKLKINDLKRQLLHWRKVASGEVLSFRPGPRKPQPGKPYRKASKPRSPTAPSSPSR